MSLVSNRNSIIDPNIPMRSYLVRPAGETPLRVIDYPFRRELFIPGESRPIAILSNSDWRLAVDQLPKQN